MRTGQLDSPYLRAILLHTGATRLEKNLGEGKPPPGSSKPRYIPPAMGGV